LHVYYPAFIVLTYAFIELYDNNVCTTKTAVLNVAGTYSIVGQSNSIPRATEADFVLTSRTMQPLFSPVADVFNYLGTQFGCWGGGSVTFSAGTGTLLHQPFAPQLTVLLSH